MDAHGEFKDEVVSKTKDSGNYFCYWCEKPVDFQEES